MTISARRAPIGANSMWFWNLTVEQAVPEVAALGFDAVEIWAEHLWRGDENPRQVAAALDRERLRRTVHGPVMDVNITSANRGIREESVRQVLRAVELAHELEAELVVVHPGRRSSKHGSLSDCWAQQLDAFERIVAHGQKYGVRVGVENMDAYKAIEEVVLDHEDINRVTGHFPARELGLVLDTTHLAYTERILGVISRVDHIIHTHLSDARPAPSGAMETHLLIGDGEIDFEQVLANLLPRYGGILSLETFIPADRQKIIAQRQKIEAIQETVQ